MFKFRIVGFAISMTILSVFPAVAQDHHDRPDPVQVVNTPTVSVANMPSVTVGALPAIQLAPGATVGVVGTPSVNVSSLPAVQLAPGSSVGITGTPSVLIGNDPSSPIPMHDTSRPNRTPFQIAQTIQLDDTVAAKQALVPVPAGKRLVIEFASAQAAAFNDPGVKVLFSIFTTANQPGQAEYSLLSTDVGTFLNKELFLASQSVKLFSNPGTNVALEVIRDIPNNIVTANFSISGYLEDAQ